MSKKPLSTPYTHTSPHPCNEPFNPWRPRAALGPRVKGAGEEELGLEGAEGGAWGVKDLPGVPPTTYPPRHLSAAPIQRVAPAPAGCRAQLLGF